MGEMSKKTALVVDDEELIREFVGYAFEQQNFTVIEAVNGKEAFDIIQSKKIDIVVSDVRMPNGSGIELLDKLRKWNSYSPPLIFISGFFDISTPLAYHKGANALFTKPFDPDDLVAAAKRASVPPPNSWELVDPANNVSQKIVMHSELPLGERGVDKIEVGRGGVFIPMTDGFPSILDLVSINITFGQNKAERLEGVGRVLWIRQKILDDYLPGIGVEFIQLQPESIQLMTKYLKTPHLTPYIPAGMQLPIT